MAEMITSATRLTHITLANGVLMPRLGLGTFRSRDDDVRKAVLCALRCGYTHIGNRLLTSYCICICIFTSVIVFSLLTAFAFVSSW
jgi:hypothetical protein